MIDRGHFMPVSLSISISKQKISSYPYRIESQW